jgi:hypothetical protein
MRRVRTACVKNIFDAGSVIRCQFGHSGEEHLLSYLRLLNPRLADQFLVFGNAIGKLHPFGGDDDCKWLYTLANTINVPYDVLVPRQRVGTYVQVACLLVRSPKDAKGYTKYI